MDKKLISINVGHSLSKEHSNNRLKLISWLKFLIFLLFICFIVSNTIGLTLVSGVSMNPTLKDHSLLLINKFSARFGTPVHGDVVLVNRNGYMIIKRVIGLPGDKVSIKNGIVFVNQSPLPEIYTIGMSNDMPPITVGTGRIFVMGDNRTPGESLDSRNTSVGQVPITSIKGYGEVSLFPLERIMKPLKL